MPGFKSWLSFAILVVLQMAEPVQAQSLKGSSAVMKRQHLTAIDYNYSFLKTSSDVLSFYELGYLVKVSDSNTMEIHNVSYPYARPEVKLFLERLSNQYQTACGEKLTVTSLTRPLDKQPRNASDVSVHPTGMAVDLRIPRKGRCRSWLESTLLSLERSDVLDVTRERYPPHYHLAIFTKTYTTYVANLKTNSRDSYDYTVRRGDSLYLIARRNDTSIDALRATNGLNSDMLQIGQVLQIPGAVDDSGSTESVAVTNQMAEVSEFTHRVRKGDTLWQIATRYGVSITRLMDVNGLSGDLLRVGQTLKINSN